MYNHYSQSVSAHRRIVSNLIKPTHSRITSSQTRSKSNHKQLNSTLLSGYLEKAMSREQQPNAAPLQIVERYFQEGYLMKNHEKIMSALSFVSGETRKYLQFNYLQITEMIENFSFQQNNQALIFKMYETLHDLDVKIVQELFNHKKSLIDSDSNRGEQQKNYFRFDTLINLIESMNDLVSNILKITEDKAIAVFIEQIWKFIVVVLDLCTQWTQDRYSQLMNGQIDGYRDQIKQLEKENLQLQEKMNMQQKAYQLKLVVEQKKNFSLREENNKISQQYNNLEDQLHEFGNIDTAKGDLQNIATKLHEMDMNFIKYNKEINETHKQASSSIKQLAKLLVTKPQQPKSFIQLQSELLDLKFEEQPISNNLMVNPLISQIELNFYCQEQCNQKQMASDFIQYLFFNINKHPSLSGPELFLIWVHSDEQAYVKGRIDLLKKLSQLDDPYSLVLNQILGINRQHPVSFKVLDDSIKLMKLIEANCAHNNHNQSRSSVIEKYSSFIDLEVECNIANISQVIPKQLQDYFEAEVMNRGRPLKLIDLMLHMIPSLQQQEQCKWEQFIKFYLHNINTMDFRLEDIKQFYNIDTLLLWQLIIIQSRNAKPSDTISIEEYAHQLYLLWIYHPRCLVKPYTENTQPQQSSPAIKRQQSIQKSTPLLKKQNTILSESIKKK